jgi:integrase
MVINPAASVRGLRYEAVEGKTPEITIEQAQKLLTSIRTERKTKDGKCVPLVVGLRDRAIIATLIYTAARAGAVAHLRIRDFQHDGSQWVFRFNEKGGKSREIPVRHDLQQFILAYLAHVPDWQENVDAPVFRTAIRKTGKLTPTTVNNIDICRMIKRRLADAKLPSRLSPHSFRVTTITDLLTQGVPLEDVQYLAGHVDPRTTRLYDRRQRHVSRNIVERISI